MRDQPAGEEHELRQLGTVRRGGAATNCSFDAATFEIWGALLHGARLSILAKDVALSPQDLAARIRQDQDQRPLFDDAAFQSGRAGVARRLRAIALPVVRW